MTVLKFLPFVVMQRVARVCQRQLSYLFRAMSMLPLHLVAYWPVVTMKRYDSAVYAVNVCPSVRHKSVF